MKRKYKRERAIIDFLLCTGVRVSELINIKMKDVNLNDNSVQIYAPKTNDYRTVFLDAKAKKTH